MSAKRQEELRRLMRDKLAKKTDKHVVVPALARLNNLNQLVCTVCNVSMKSTNLWTAHILSKKHKETVENATKVGPSREGVLKRKVKDESTPAVSEKKLKPERISSNGSGFQKETSESGFKLSLPPGFFDADIPTTVAPAQPEIKSQLPEGFFDDPVKDAEARNVVYEDPKEKEWLDFQKMVEMESQVAEHIIDEDADQLTLERDITEIDSQISCFNKVNCLREHKETHCKLTMEIELPVNDNSSDLSDVGIDDVLDWRSKSFPT